MNKSNTIVIGNGYIGSAYSHYADFTTITRDQWSYIDNIDQLIPLIKNYDYVINCVAITNTTWSEQPSNFKQVWATNVVFVQQLSEYCLKTNKKLIHLSTTDLYGNSHDWNINNENRRDLDIATNYRASKFAGERVCNPSDLILRIRLPFDGRNHPKNLLTKLPKFNRLYNFMSDYTYIPDLVNATTTLANEQGIYNVTSFEADSLCNICKNILKIKPHDIECIEEISNIHVFNTCDNSKLEEKYKCMDLHASLILSQNELTNNPIAV